MSTFAIRWLGAFSQGSNFSSSLKWELEENNREVAAEWFDYGYHFDGIHSKLVGLLVEKGAIVRRYNGDVWSVAEGERLVATRSSTESTQHSECFCKPQYRGIVIRRHLDQLRPEIRRVIVQMAKKHNLAIYIFTHKREFKKLTLRRW